MNKKPSFFERITGGVSAEETERNVEEEDKDWIDEVEESTGEGELSVDMYQTPDKIILEAMIAGVKPEDLDVHITRDMVTIKGSRQESKTIEEENYFHKELYWGSFSRSILLPQEIEPEEAEAAEKHGLLVITLPKIDREKSHKVKVKSS